MKCPHCNGDFEPVEDLRFCPLCGQRLGENTGEPSEPSGPASYGGEPLPEPFEEEREEYCPWEDQEDLGFSQALGLTLKQSMFYPTAFFEKMPLHRGFSLPLLFAVIVGTVSYMAAYLSSMAVGSAAWSELVGSSRNALLFALAIPLLVFLGIFVSTVVLHLSLFLVGGAKEDFEVTFRVVCYTSGPQLLAIVPVLGGLASLIWNVYLMIAGLREAHGISNGRAVAAIALPGLLCCGIGVAALVSFGLLVSSH